MRASAASKAASAASGSPEPENAASRPGDQLRQHLARASALDRGAAAEMPAADGLGRRLGPMEAETAQRRQRVGIIHHAGEDEAAGFRAQARRVFEQARVMLFDLAQMMHHLIREDFDPA